MIIDRSISLVFMQMAIDSKSFFFSSSFFVFLEFCIQLKMILGEHEIEFFYKEKRAQNGMVFNKR